MLDYKLVEALASVVTEGGFEKAAQRLAITQSAVSQRIRLLEEQVGRILLVRSSPPEATRAGAGLLKHWHQVRRLEADLFDELSPGSSTPFDSMAIGVNADSIATWFVDAVLPFLENEKVTLDIRVDDQDQTHALLKKGDVIGCISSLDRQVQGCSVECLGSMTYRLVASHAFCDRWFPRGVDKQSLAMSPLLVFNRKDTLHRRVLDRVPGGGQGGMPVHYLPSSEKFVDYIVAGVASGMLPDLQARELLEGGTLMELFPDLPVRVTLYWHCWNLRSPFIRRFSDHLKACARTVLE